MEEKKRKKQQKKPLFPQFNTIVLLGAKKKKPKNKYLLLSTVGASYLLCLLTLNVLDFFSHFHWKTEEELSSANFHPF